MNMEREWICSQLDKESIDYLRELPSELKLKFGGIKIHAYHATPKSLFEVVLPHESEAILSTKMMEEEVDLFVYAHIHKPYIRYINGKCIMNIGSVGLPFDGLAKASYDLVDINEGSFQTSIMRVAYNLNQTIDQFAHSDYPNKDMMIEVIRNGKI